jgi:hypothetical protein
MARRGRLQPLLVAATGLVAVAYVGVVDPNQPGHYPTCPFLALTGCYCPGCGSMRAVHAIVHGDLAQALHRNPLTVLLLPVLGLLWLRWLRDSATPGPARPLILPQPVVWAVLAALGAFWVLRNLPGFSWLAPA